MTLPLPVIPVLDLMGGQVVHAVRGERASYQPVRSALAPGSEPRVIGQALLHLCGGGALYVADLDGIVHQRPQLGPLQALLGALPEVTLWLDAGLASPAAWALLAQALGPQARRVRPVFGTESLQSADGLAAVSGAVLSLDQRKGQPMDPCGLWQQPEAWPDTLVLMTLDRVGADQGPDLPLLREQRARRPQAQWVGAGGIRHPQDLAAAAAAGAAAWLVASALHDGRLGRPG